MKAHHFFMIVCLLCSCTTNPKGKNELKKLPFEVSGKAEAMPSFQKGLLLIHNFEYDDAAEAFREAQKIDPDFAMAYWGEAMTYNHPVWGDLDIDKARNTLNKLGNSDEARSAKAKTALEKDFITSLDILYGSKTKKVRDIEYSLYLEKMYERYKGNNEVAAFYALSLLGIKNGWNQMEDANFKAANISKDILIDNPTHPGALHYLIHSDDHPEYAEKALAAARDYARVASYAGHALHMPSHIYLALGMWDDVVTSNEISWQAGVDRMKRKSGTNDDLNYHAYLWLLYGYLQQGRFQKAEEVLLNQSKYTNEMASPDARFHLLMMKGHYLFETMKWKSSLSDLEIETSDLSIDIRSINRFINGTKAYYRNELKVLEAIIKEMDYDINKAKEWKLTDANITICGVTALVDKIPSQYQINNSEVLNLELKALAAWLTDDLKTADGYFLRAVEKSSGFLIGPPKIIKPPQELYGEFLMTSHRNDDAGHQFQAALMAAPNRVLSLKGQLSTLSKPGSEKQANDLQNRLKDILKNSDSQM